METLLKIMIVGVLLFIAILLPVFFRDIADWLASKCKSTEPKKPEELKDKVQSCNWLVKAVEDGDIEKIKRLIAAGSSIHSRKEEYITGYGDTLFEVAMKVSEKPFSEEIAEFFYHQQHPDQEMLDRLMRKIILYSTWYDKYEDRMERMRYIISKGGKIPADAMAKAIGTEDTELEKFLREEMKKKDRMEIELLARQAGVYSYQDGFTPWKKIVSKTLEAPKAKVILPQGMTGEKGAEVLGDLYDKSEILSITKYSVDLEDPLYDIRIGGGPNIAIGNATLASNANGGVNIGIIPSEGKECDSSYEGSYNNDPEDLRNHWQILPHVAPNILVNNPLIQSIPVTVIPKKDRKAFKKKEKERRNDKNGK